MTNTRLPTIFTQVDRLVCDPAFRAAAIMLMSAVRAPRTLLLVIPVRIFGKPMLSMIPMMTTTMSISTSEKPLRRAVTVAPLGSIDPAPPARAGGPLLSQAAYHAASLRDRRVGISPPSALRAPSCTECGCLR